MENQLLRILVGLSKELYLSIKIKLYIFLVSNIRQLTDKCKPNLLPQGEISLEFSKAKQHFSFHFKAVSLINHGRRMLCIFLFTSSTLDFQGISEGCVLRKIIEGPSQITRCNGDGMGSHWNSTLVPFQFITFVHLWKEEEIINIQRKRHSSMCNSLKLGNFCCMDFLEMQNSYAREFNAVPI